MISNKRLNDLQDKFHSLLKNKTNEKLLEEEEYILMANYLSEIESIQKENGLNRKDLAFKIKKSPSYLTQVFRGDKPLNFDTIARIQRALNVKFRVIAVPVNESAVSYDVKVVKLKPASFDKLNDSTQQNFYVIKREQNGSVTEMKFLA
jgi:ribosome-binding protein aMBF1 (putative translation factor)